MTGSRAASASGVDITPREAEVLRAVVAKASNAEIAQDLTISVRTVESHISSLLTKYGVPDRGSLVKAAGADRSWISEIDLPIVAARRSQASNFVGRVSEMQALVKVWDQAALGEQRFVVITGEAGIGKTRLASEFAAYASKNAGIALYGRCDAERRGPLEVFSEALLPYLEACPVDELKRDVGDLVGDLHVLAPREVSEKIPRLTDTEQLDANIIRYRLFEAIRRVLQAASKRAPLLIVLDDLHAAPPQTLLLLRYLIKEGSPDRTMFLGTQIVAESSRDLTAFLAETNRAGIRATIELSGLNRPEVAQLVGEVGDEKLALDIYSETQGNPFFTVELIRHLQEKALTRSRGVPLEIPSGVFEVVTYRVDRLSEAAQRILRFGAVLGQQFDALVLQRLVGLDEDELVDGLEEAVASHLLHDVTGTITSSAGGERFEFAHAIVRRSLLKSMSLSRRRRTHAAAARAIEASYPDSTELHADEIAGHLVQAGQITDQRDTFRYLTMAGRAALAAAAPEEALSIFGRAASLRDQASPHELAELTFQQGMAQRAVGRWTDAIESWSESLAIAAVLQDIESISRTCRAASHNLVWAMRPQEASNLITNALSQVGSASAERARMLGARSFAQAWAGDYEGSSASIEAELRAADELNDAGLRNHALAMRTQQLPAFLEHTRAVEAGFQAAEALRLEDDPWTLTSMLGFLKYELVGLGRIPEAKAIGAELGPLAEKIGNFATLQQHLRMEAMMEFFRSGNVHELGVFAAKDRELSLAVGLGVLEHSLAWLGMARFLAGDWAGARNFLTSAAESEPQTAMTGWGLSSLLEFQAYTRDHRAAMETWDNNAHLVATPGANNTCGGWTMAVVGAEALAVIGDLDQAHSLYATISDCITRTGVVCIEYRGGKLLNRSAAVAAAAGGDWETAEDHFALALREARAMPHVVEGAHTLRLHGAMLLKTGSKSERARAEELLAEAAHFYDSFGMPRFRDLCRDA